MVIRDAGGRPVGFQDVVRDVTETKALEDQLIAALGEARSVLTTAKDYWRDPAVFADLPVPAFILPLTVAWSEEELAKAISSAL